MENSTKLNEALEYLKSVEVEFQHDRIKYDVFTEVLKDYKAEKIDIEGMKVRVKGLFKEHTNLISRFNAFLPKEHQITPRLELEDGLAFYRAVKDAFQDKRENFDEFLNLMMDWKYERVDIRSFVARMKELLKEHTDLILGFNLFMPFQLDVPDTTCNQFKGDDASRVRCSNNREYYAAVSECKDDFKKERSKRSKRRDFSSIIEYILESKNREDVVGRYNEGCEKLTPTKRRTSNTSHRVEFEIVDKVNSDDDETFSSNEGSKKNITKRQAKNERSNKPLKKRKINNNNNNDNDQLQEERPELPLVFKEKIDLMEGSDVMLVMQKELTMTDVTENNARLSIPEKQVINENFLEPNTSHRVEFEILDKVSSDADETSSSGAGSKKKIVKREAKNERSNKPLKKHKINNNNNDNDQLREERPGLPLVFKEKIEQMEGSDVMLVMQKKLTKTDVTANNNRLSIPQNECITENFLESEEKSSLDYVRGKHDKCHTMSVSMLDPSVTLYDGMCFKKWRMVKSETYNITGKWNKLVVENQLEGGQKVQLWSFRSHRQLCFALVKL